MNMPQHFDGNEWFSVISMLLICCIVFSLPRRFPAIVTIVFLCLGLGIAMYADFHFGVPPLDFYDINDTQRYELFDLILFVLYSPFAYLFMYFFDKWRPRGLWINVYILAWSAGGTLYEGLAAYLHVYKYKEWKLGYSFFFYLAAQAICLLFYYIIKSIYNRTKHHAGYDWS
ncbi:MAG: hypothetical protein K0S39_4253 [Paenibacillus sp.]|jgi:hypothetical protein|nr:hypothetical protein [Paenibacillus sp.]